MDVQRLVARAVAGIGIATLISACGGGGGDAGPVLREPPSTAALLSASTSDAQSVAQAAVNGGATVVARAAGVESSFFVFGNPLGAGSTPLSLAGRVMSATRERAAAVQTVTCADFFDSAACTGSVTVDTNLSSAQAVWPAGTYVAMSFNALSGTLGGVSFSMNGAVRIDFLTSFDPVATTFQSIRIQLTTSNVSGSAGGVSFGPESGVALIEFDSAGNGSLTVDGLRITGLAGLTTTDANSYGMSGTRLRGAHWSAPLSYVDVTYSNWVVSGGRPQLGSNLVVSAGTASATVTVTSLSSTTVVYAVAFNVGGVVTRYAVTASYPAGGGPPSYAAVVSG